MSENFAEMLANEEWKEIHTGEVVDGTVIAVKEDHIVLNIGYKHDGIITRSEYSSTPGIDLTTVVSVGDEMKAKVLKLNDGEGQVLLTYRKLVAESGSKRLEEAFNNKEAITANVSRVIKGGLEVVVDETRIFIPASLVSDSYVKDFSEYNGKEITFVLTEYDPKNRKVIGDCKQLIVAKKKAAQEELLSKIKEGEGQVLLTYRKLVAESGSKRLEEAFNNKEAITANVSRVIKGGLEVVVDETRIFIPASLVSDSYVKDFSEYNGKEITFVLTEYDPKNRKVIGDCKQLIVAKKKAAQEELLSKIKEGDTIEGTVKNVTDFGAFIDLGGVDGLLHISEMSWGRTENPKKVYKVGDSVKCFIKEINGDKIALSVKYPDQNPWNDASTKYAVGNVVTGKVARMTDFGAFVQLEDGIDALLHVSQISKEHINKPEDVLKIGQEIEAKVVDLNEADKKISLSMKALLDDAEPQEEATEE